MLPRPVKFRGPAWALLLTLLALIGTGPHAVAEEPLPRQLEGVGLTERLDTFVDKSTPLIDHEGRGVTLGDYLRDGKPVLLTLNYYRCTSLCNLQLNALTEGLRGLGWKPGEQFRILTISIDHREQPDLAKGKRASYLSLLGRGEVDWTFLVGSEASVRKIADEVGYGFKYDKEQDQFAHPAVLTFLSPGGKISRYLYGVEYAPRDLKFALMEASEGRVGSTADRIILSCFHYDPSLGAYGPFAMGIMRLGGVLTLFVLAVMLATLWRRERTRRREATT